MFKRVVTTALALLASVGIASAAPALPDGPVFFQFNNMEQLNLGNSLIVPGGYNGTNTQGNWGVFLISSMQDGGVSSPHNDISGGTPTFSDSLSGGQLTGIFYGVQVISGDPVSGNSTAIGGTVDIYWQPPGTSALDNDCLSGTTCLANASTVNKFTTNSGNGQLLVRLQFASGVIGGNDTVTLASGLIPFTETGHAEAYANVDTSINGAWTAALNQNWFFIDGSDAGTVKGDAGVSEQRDIRFGTFFDTTLDSWDAAGGTTGLRSNDPARGFAAVPEPATLTLLGGGLLGLARMRRKKAQA